jgi:2,4-dichlorophenol 6-monooxygenase
MPDIGCGLNLSIFLSDRNVSHILFEKHEGTSLLPKAHYLNQRSLEIFRLHGYASELRTKGTPMRNMCQTTYATSLGGDGPYDRKVLHTTSSFGGDEGSEMLRRFM